MLTVRQQAIKMHVEAANADGRKPTVKGIAEAYGCTCDDVRADLAAIRREHRKKKEQADILSRMFMGTGLGDIFD